VYNRVVRACCYRKHTLKRNVFRELRKCTQHPEIITLQEHYVLYLLHTRTYKHTNAREHTSQVTAIYHNTTWRTEVKYFIGIEIATNKINHKVLVITLGQERRC
jgi:hypothetical protein